MPGQAVPRLAAAATRTAQDSYRVRLAGSKSNGAHSSSGTAVGVFDPARRTGRLVPTDGGAEVRYVGDMVYRQLPGGLPGASGRTRAWLASRQEGPPEGVSELAELGGRALQDPQQALAWVRSAGGVREQGRVSGDGWAGVRYAFELTDRRWQVTGTVDVDTDGRVRAACSSPPGPPTRPTGSPGPSTACWSSATSACRRGSPLRPPSRCARCPPARSTRG